MMARRAFFSFEYSDVQRAMVVRNSWVTQGRDAAGFIDAAEFEKLEKSGGAAVRRWIDDQLNYTSVTAVLVGQYTCSSRWVAYEIEQSVKRGNGLLGIDISKIKNMAQQTTDCCGTIPTGYPFFRWFRDDGYHKLGTWIDDVAKAAGR